MAAVNPSWDMVNLTIGKSRQIQNIFVSLSHVNSKNYRLKHGLMPNFVRMRYGKIKISAIHSWDQSVVSVFPIKEWRRSPGFQPSDSTFLNAVNRIVGYRHQRDNVIWDCEFFAFDEEYSDEYILNFLLSQIRIYLCTSAFFFLELTLRNTCRQIYSYLQLFLFSVSDLLSAVL